MAAFALEIFQTATVDGKLAINHERWETHASGGDAEQFLSWVQQVAYNTRFIVTDRGYGIAPAVAQEEDECVIIHGGKMPFLLRKAVGVGNYKFIGAMLHSSAHEYEDRDTGYRVGVGLEEGKDWKDWNIEEQEFCLV